MPKSKRPTGERVEVYLDDGGEWRWRYFAANGEEEDASTEGYNYHRHAIDQGRSRNPEVPLFTLVDGVWTEVTLP